MKIINFTKYLVAIISIVFIFINWKIAIALFILASIFYVIPFGVSVLLGVISGYLIASGIIFIFFDWKISIILILLGLVVTKFRIWSMRVYEKYQDDQNKRQKNTQINNPEDYHNEIGQSFTEEDMLKAAKYAGELLRDGKTPLGEVFSKPSKKYGVPEKVLHSLIKVDL